VRSRRSRNVRYASNTDRIDASQQNVASCHKPTYAAQQIGRLLPAELMAQGKRAISASILLGHTHWDHIQGFPFFSPEGQLK
jgi:phosphoribosyl 1,2-cyclic phosphodiesterase